MSRVSLVPLLLIALGCAEEKSEDVACDALCGELVEACEFAAYPTAESCLQGCAYTREQGGDVDELQSCVEQAECNPFAIAECEHAHGS